MNESGLPSWIYPLKHLVLNDQVGRWCQLSYPNHPKGCPKYGKDKKCPPNAPKIKDYFDFDKPIWLVHSEFNLSNHILKMKEKHPGWSERQCKNVLYWQGTSRKQLRQRCIAAFLETGANIHTFVPEAMGVNVYLTARLAGLKLERIRHLKICRHVALVGTEIGTTPIQQIILL